MNIKQALVKETNTQKEPEGNRVKKKRNQTKKTTYRYDPLAKYGSWVTAGSLMLPDMN